MSNAFDFKPLTGAELEQSLALQASFMIDQMLAQHASDEALESFRLNFIRAKVERLSGADLMDMELDQAFRATAVEIFTNIELGMTWAAAQASADAMDTESYADQYETF